MKILIIGFAKLKIMPYLNLYLDNIDKEVNKITVLYWNRDLVDEDVSKYKGINLCEFRCFQEDEVAKYKKVKSFIGYRRYAKRFLIERFDRVIVLHSLPGILLLDKLINKYSGKYILDYRDSTFEQFGLFRKALGHLIKHSSITITSSDAFRKFFPKEYQDKVYTTHNILEDSLSHRDYERIPSSKLRISFWGQIRHEDINKAIIKDLANDNRFELHYYGREQNIAKALKEYVIQLNAKNVFFHGEYTATDRYEFAKVTDVIHNIYYDNNTMLAMGNKYYDGLIFRIPQICMPGSYMGELSENNHVGKSISPYDSTFADQLYTYIKSINQEDFIFSANNALKKVLNDYELSVIAIKKALL